MSKFYTLLFVNFFGLFHSANAEPTLCRGKLDFSLNDKQYKIENFTVGSSPCVFKPVNHRGKFTSIDIIDQPRHGKIYKNDDFFYYYKASENFTGQDRYSYKICGDDKGKFGCAYIKFIVYVE